MTLTTKTSTTTTSTEARTWMSQIELILVPSFACNLRCKHCFTEPVAGASMAPELALGLIHSADALGLRAVQVTGGEVLAYKHHRRLLDALSTLPIPSVVSTNASLLEPDHAALLEGSRVALCVSLDGPAPVHDAIRGEGSFAAIVAAAALCRRHGIELSFSSTVTRSALSHVGATARLAAELGASAICFSPLLQLGGRSKTLVQEGLDDEQCVELLAQLSVLKEQAADAGFGVFSRNIGMKPTAVTHPCSVFACWGQACPSKKHWPLKIYVMPDGEVLPQSLHINRRYSLGNVQSERLAAILARYWGSPLHQRFQRLCRHVYQDLIYSNARPFFFWDELIRRASAQSLDDIPSYQTVSHPHDHGPEIARARRRGRLPLLQFPLR